MLHIEELVFTWGSNFEQIVFNKNIHIFSYALPKKTQGLYMMDKNCIVVKKGLKKKYLIFILWHELLHALFPEAPEHKIEEWSFYFARRYEFDIKLINIVHAEEKIGI